jgi:hypothetical protein
MTILILNGEVIKKSRGIEDTTIPLIGEKSDETKKYQSRPDYFN